MNETARIQAFVQSVYLIRYNRYIDDIIDPDGIIEVAKTLDFANQFIEELEQEADWNFSRETAYSLGTVTTVGSTFTMPDDVLRLVIDEGRPLTVSFDTSIVSTWEIVDPNRLFQAGNMYAGDKVAVSGSKIVFSRPFRTYEIGGTVKADIVLRIPRFTTLDATPLDVVKPNRLLILGTAKDATLPDIVQGGLSPSFVQKYADLLEKTLMQNNMSSSASSYQREDYSSIGGIY